MLLKEIILFSVIFIAILPTEAHNKREKFTEASELLDRNSEELHFEQKKNYKEKQEFKKNKGVNPEVKHQFEKDYKRWDEQNARSQEYPKHFEKMNEIESDEFIDKYNMYGKNRNHNFADKSYKKHKKFHHEHHDQLDKSDGLIYDTDVNYLEKNKKIEQNSELINEKYVDLQKSKENYQENYQNKNELYEKRNKKSFYLNLQNLDLSEVPRNNTYLLARYLVHAVDWVAMATLSTKNVTKGAPFVCAKAMSDGPVDKSTGVPFFYLSSLDMCAKDLEKNPKVSVLATLSQTDFCKNKNLDSQDPRCAKVTLSGEIKRLKPGSEEENFAKNALFSRHPVMAKWPSDHTWYFAKVKLTEVALIYKFGGVAYLNVKEYLNGGPLKPQF